MRRQFCSKLIRRIDRRIDVPADLFLRRSYRVHDVLEWRISYDQEIDVAGRAQLTPGGGSKHESDLDPLAQRRERVAQDVDEPGSFREQSAQFRKNWRVAVCLEIDLTPLNRAPQQSCSSQELQFSLHGPDSRTSLTGDLPKVVRLVSVAEQPGEDPTPSAAEEHRCRVRRCPLRVCSQDGDISTLNTNMRQGPALTRWRGKPGHKTSKGDFIVGGHELLELVLLVLHLLDQRR
jgi:hypothetical protein